MIDEVIQEQLELALSDSKSTPAARFEALRKILSFSFLLHPDMLFDFALLARNKLLGDLQAINALVRACLVDLWALQSAPTPISVNTEDIERVAANARSLSTVSGLSNPALMPLGRQVLEDTLHLSRDAARALAKATDAQPSGSTLAGLQDSLRSLTLSFDEFMGSLNYLRNLRELLDSPDLAQKAVAGAMSVAADVLDESLRNLAETGSAESALPSVLLARSIVKMSSGFSSPCQNRFDTRVRGQQAQLTGPVLVSAVSRCSFPALLDDFLPGDDHRLRLRCQTLSGDLLWTEDLAPFGPAECISKPKIVSEQEVDTAAVAPFSSHIGVRVGEIRVILPVSSGTPFTQAMGDLNTALLAAGIGGCDWFLDAGSKRVMIYADHPDLAVYPPKQVPFEIMGDVGDIYVGGGRAHGSAAALLGLRGGQQGRFTFTATEVAASLTRQSARLAATVLRGRPEFVENLLDHQTLVYAQSSQVSRAAGVSLRSAGGMLFGPLYPEVGATCKVARPGGYSLSLLGVPWPYLDYVFGAHVTILSGPNAGVWYITLPRTPPTWGQDGTFAEFRVDVYDGNGNRRRLASQAEVPCQISYERLGMSFSNIYEGDYSKLVIYTEDTFTARRLGMVELVYPLRNHLEVRQGSGLVDFNKRGVRRGDQLRLFVPSTEQGTYELDTALVDEVVPSATVGVADRRYKRLRLQRLWLPYVWARTSTDLVNFGSLAVVARSANVYWLEKFERGLETFYRTWLKGQFAVRLLVRYRTEGTISFVLDEFSKALSADTPSYWDTLRDELLELHSALLIAGGDDDVVGEIAKASGRSWTGGLLFPRPGGADLPSSPGGGLVTLESLLHLLDFRPFSTEAAQAVAALEEAGFARSAELLLGLRFGDFLQLSPLDATYQNDVSYWLNAVRATINIDDRLVPVFQQSESRGLGLLDLRAGVMDDGVDVTSK